MGEYNFLGENTHISKSFFKDVYDCPNLNFKSFLSVFSNDDLKNIDAVSLFPYIHAILNDKKIIEKPNLKKSNKFNFFRK